jgi:O-antigen ligase
MPAQVATQPAPTQSVEPITASARIVALYVFLLFCRILEMLPLFGLGQLRLMLLVTVVALAVVFLTGNLLKAVKTPLGILLIAWTAWMVVCMPFSTWRSETLNQFLNNWLKSLMVFFIVAGLASTRAAFHKAMSAMAWAAAVACLLVLPGLAAAGTGNGVSDRLFGVGTLSNPNEIAFHLWLGMSFLVLLALRSRPLRKVFLLAICCLELALILKTVSREGLLLALVVLVFTLLRVSLLNKAKVLVCVLAVCVFALLSLPRQSLDRYLTLFTSSVSSEAASSATASSRMRHQKLVESIELTLRHPIFGVGMGVFMPASVEIAKEKGTHADWEVSHNSYTQVSSELGFPGILLLLAIYGVGFRQIWQVDRMAKGAEREDVRQQAFVLMLALGVLCIHFCFDSMAYVFYMPLVTGLIAAFTSVYRPLLLDVHVDRASGSDAVQARTPASQPVLKQSVAPRDSVLAQKNPYRFGRKR